MNRLIQTLRVSINPDFSKTGFQLMIREVLVCNFDLSNTSAMDLQSRTSRTSEPPHDLAFLLKVILFFLTFLAINLFL